MRLDCYLAISILALVMPAFTTAGQLNQSELSTHVATHIEEDSGRDSSIDDKDGALGAVELMPYASERASPKRPANIKRAYADAFQILKADNPCSRFFGGPVAIQVLY